MSTEVVEQANSLAYIDVNLIKNNKEALREVDRKGSEYIELADAVRKQGVMSAITVRKMRDVETGEEFYSLIDGLQRLTAARDAGFPTIPAQILSANDYDVMVKQLVSNAARVITKPVEYSKHLQRMLQHNPTMTVADLGAMISQTDVWVKDRLKLTSLVVECAKLVDDGVINISNAFALSKLPTDEQANYLEQAQTMPVGEFTPLVLQRLEELKKARRAGGTETPNVFTPVAYMRKIGDVKSENENNAIGNAYIAQNRITSPEEGWALAIKWCLSLDPLSLAAQKKKWEDTKKAGDDKREKAKIERERRKAADADVKSQRAKLQLTLLENGSSEEATEAALKAFDEEHKKAEATAEAAK